MSKLPIIEIIYPLHNMMIIEGGESVPITNWIDADGEETDDYEEAVSCVAGPTVKGKWLVVIVSDLEVCLQ